MSVVPVRSRLGRVDFAKAVQASVAHRVVRPGVEVRSDAAPRPAPPPAPAPDAGGSPPATPPAAPPAPAPTPTSADTAPVLRLWDERMARLAAKLLDRPVFRRGSDSLFVPKDTERAAISFDGVHIKTVILDRGASAAAADQSINVAADASMIDVVPPQRLIEFDAIALTNQMGRPAQATRREAGQATRRAHRADSDRWRLRRRGARPRQRRREARHHRLLELAGFADSTVPDRHCTRLDIARLNRF